MQMRLLALALLLLPTAARAAKPDPPPDHWVATWATAPYALDNKNATFGAADTTYRQVIHTSLAGPLLRVTFTNEFGTEPLIIGAAHVALADPTTNTDIQLVSANALTFNGLPSIIIPPGAVALSDPASIALPFGANVTISVFIPAQKITHVSYHGAAYTTGYSAAGNVVGQRTLADAKKNASWYFLKSLDVKTTFDTAAVVAFGDSITDGAGSTSDANNTWPALLAARLHGNKKTEKLAVVNEGIGGNRILHDNTGPSALNRFDQVLALPGIRYLVLLEGINDIGHAKDLVKPFDDVSAADLEQGLAQLIERAHEHGILVFGATLTPYLGAKYASPAGEAERNEYNNWIRKTTLLDGVIDFDHATADPTTPNTFRQTYQRGDQLHPNPAGYKAMADSINLKLFELTKQQKADITHQP